MVLVPELVGHHLEHLVAREVVDQVVVEHHPLAVPEPVHVGVHGGGAPAGVHPVDLPTSTSGRGAPARAPAMRSWPLGQRLELVEERVDHHGEEPDRSRPRTPPRQRAGHPPAPAEAAHERQRQRPADRREGGGEPRRLRPRPQPRSARTGSRGPRRCARSCARPRRAAARSRRAASEIPAPTAAPPSSGRRARRSSSRRGGRSERSARVSPIRQPEPGHDQERWWLRKSSARSSCAGLKYSSTSTEAGSIRPCAAGARRWPPRRRPPQRGTPAAAANA